MKTLTHPNIETMKSDPKKVLDRYTKALTSVSEALDAQIEARPRPQDYVCEDDFNRAAIKHMRRTERLAEVSVEDLNMMLDLSDQLVAKKHDLLLKALSLATDIHTRLKPPIPSSSKEIKPC